MIILGTKLAVVDNSGAKTALCVGIYGGTGKKSAGVGEIIRVSIRELNRNANAKDNNRVKRGETFLAVIVRTKQPIRRADGSTLRYDHNACALLTKGNIEIIGTRFSGSMPRELKESFLKITSSVKLVV